MFENIIKNFNQIGTNVSKVTVNGKTIKINGAQNISICNGRIIVDGKVIDDTYNGNANIIIDGNVTHLDCTGSVTVNGNATNIYCNGSVSCGDVNGSVDCGGSCTCGDVSGNVEAGGSVSVIRRN